MTSCNQNTTNRIQHRRVLKNKKSEGPMKKTFTLRRDQISAFLKAIRHNGKVIRQQIKSGKIYDFDYYFVKVENGELVLIPPGRHNMSTSRSSNDFIAGALVGALPFLELHGSDGIKVDECGEVKQVELKLCMKDPSRYTISESGRITVKDSVEVVGYRSDAAVHYEIVNNIEGKRVDTYVVFCDDVTWEVISAHRMDGDTVVDLISKNQVTGEDKTSKKRSITLASIMKHGKEVFLSGVDSVGVEEWEKRIYDREGRDPSEAEGYWNDTRKTRLTVLWRTGVKLDVIMKEFPEKKKTAIQSQAKYLGLRRPQNQ
jgi:hypothetical protein